MRFPAPGQIVSTLALLPWTALAINLECGELQDQGVHWDLRKLGGLRSVSDNKPAADGQTKNTTFLFDICKNLELEGVAHEGCGTGTRICAFERFYDKETKEEPKAKDIWPIAGEFSLSHGKSLNARVERIKHSDSNSDTDKEGVRVQVEGGVHEGNPQRAFFEFICDPNTSGLDDEEDKDDERRVKRADDDNDDKKPSGPITKVEWGDEAGSSKVWGTLRVTWRTKYACEGEAEKERDASKGWGFFTWMIIILFLGVSGYLVFGAWLNYNRYGARGWDLLPHGDTIRDVPYILKDWGRRVVNTVQGGNRDLGGYSGIRM